MKKLSFAYGAMILAFASFIAKLIGAIYRIPLTNMLGSEGIGLYQLVFPVLALLLTISSGAIPMSIGKLIATKKALNGSLEKSGVMLASLLIMLTTGIIMSLLLFLLSPLIAKAQGDESLKLCYYVLAPTVLIVAIESIFKGWFIGQGNLIPNAINQIIEQVVKLSFGLLLAKAFLSHGVIKSVCGALLGTTIAESVSLVVYFIMFLLDKDNKFAFIRVELYSNIKLLAKSAAPLGALGLIFPLAAFFDSFIIVNTLNQSLDQQVATQQYGLLTGVVNPLINMPVVISMALAVAIVPTASESYAVGDIRNLKEKACSALKMSYIIGIPCFFGVYALADDFISILYPSLNVAELELVTGLMKVASINIILISQLQLYNSLLQAIDKAKQALLNLTIGLTFRVALTLLLTKYIGINGACIAIVLFYLIALVLNSVYFKHLLGQKNSLVKNISKLLFLGVIMFLLIMLTTVFINSHLISLIVGLAVGVVIYIIGILYLGIFSETEWNSIPLGKFIYQIAKKAKGEKHGNQDG